MSRITTFSISGLVGKKTDYHKELNSDVNIFFGLNGSGKTSLLKILHSALSRNTDILQYVPFKEATIKIYSHQENKEFTCEVKQINDDRLKKDDLSLGEIFQLDVTLPKDIPEEIMQTMIRRHRIRVENGEIKWVVKPQRPKWRGLRHTYLPISRLYVTGLPIRHPKLTEEQLDLLFARHLQELWIRHSAETLYTIRKAQEEGLSNIFKAILSPPKSDSEREAKLSPNINPEVAYQRAIRFLERQKAENILGSLDEFNKRYQTEPHIRSVVSDIDEVEKRIEQALKPRAKLEELAQKMFKDGGKEIHFSDQTIEIKTDNNVELGLHVLSSGEKQLMLLLIETFLAGESCIIIDEPEISMHVDWQVLLVEAMTQINPKAQIIMATHSPEIMANIEDEKIFRL
jgi:predicted ATPase